MTIESEITWVGVVVIVVPGALPAPTWVVTAPPRIEDVTIESATTLSTRKLVARTSPPTIERGK